MIGVLCMIFADGGGLGIHAVCAGMSHGVVTLEEAALVVRYRGNGGRQR